MDLRFRCLVANLFSSYIPYGTDKKVQTPDGTLLTPADGIGNHFGKDHKNVFGSHLTL